MTDKPANSIHARNHPIKTDAAAAQALTPAQVNWHENGLPLSSTYQDVYFSRASGLDEARYVFIQHNQLTQRWPDKSGQGFTIAETGFGTGLNFLATWQCWRQHLAGLTGERPHLHFISVEKHPLTQADLKQALALWPELQTFSEQLVEQYPIAVPGFHRLYFAEDNLSLTLIFADVAEALTELDAVVDAWYLDGFAPAKNPDMWTEDLFSNMARLSRRAATDQPAASFSTYTAAGMVRRGLQAAGFKVNKVAGFGQKRDMLSGEYQTPPAPPDSPHKIWFQPPSAPQPESRRALIIGAGMAGCQTARALAERGWQVQVIDQQSDAASEASGNAQGVLYAKLPAHPTPASRIHLAGYLHSLRQLKSIPLPANTWSDCGVLQLASSASEREKQQKLVASCQYPESLLKPVTAHQASDIAAMEINHPALFFPDAGWVNPPQLCQTLLQHPLIDCRFNTRINDIQYQDRHWQLLDTQGQLVASAQVLIVACAAQAKHLTPLKSLPLQRIRGQVSQFPAPDSLPLRTVVCGHRYVAPPRLGQLSLGATFDLRDDNPEVSEQSHRNNIDQATELSPQLATALLTIPAEQYQGRVGFRCTAPDYLPIVGAMPDVAAFSEDYAALRQDAKTLVDTPPRHLPGLYVNLAHGSKGLITTPLAAELLTNLLDGEPLPLERSLLDKLNPARFTIKNLIRKSI